MSTHVEFTNVDGTTFVHPIAETKLLHPKDEAGHDIFYINDDVVSKEEYTRLRGLLRGVTHLDFISENGHTCTHPIVGMKLSNPKAGETTQGGYFINGFLVHRSQYESIRKVLLSC
jgi:hypothetical protein